MKRPLLIVAIGYIIGIIWGLYCNCSITLLYVAIVISYLLIKFFDNKKSKFKLFSFKRYFRYIKIFLKFNIIVVIVISSLISNIITINQNKKYSNLYSNIHNVTLVGVIVSNEKNKENSKIYKLKVEELNKNSKYANTYLLINTKDNENIKYGDKVKINGEFIEPNKKRNYKGFSYKDFLKTQKIYGTVKAVKIEVVDQDNLNPILMLSNKIFLKIKSNIGKTFSKETGNLILGIILGYTDELDEDIKQNFRDSNMAHILAVSGMHISYIIFAITNVCIHIVGKRKSKIIVIAVLMAYMSITGFSPSVVRATIMSIIMLIGEIIYRKNDIWTSIAISLLIILIYNPFLINSISVLLSYGGVIGVITLKPTIQRALDNIKVKNKKYKYKISKYFKGIIKYIKETLATTISIQIIIMPIIAMYFNTIGIAFLITNLMLNILTAPTIILGLIAVANSVFSIKVLKIFFFILNPLLKIIILISKICYKLPLSKIYVGTPNFLLIIIYYSFIYVCLFLHKVYSSKKKTAFEYRIRNIVSLVKYKIKQNKKRVLSSILIICIAFFLKITIPHDLKIHFIDVGQGDSTLIITPKNKTILIDGGGSASIDVGKNTLLPYLLDRKITKLDYICISHFDDDHVKGIFTIMEELKVDIVLISKQGEISENYKRFTKIVKEKNIKVKIVEKGDRLKIDKNLNFDILWPNNEELISENILNNNSVVCKLQYKNFSILFSGDIEEKAEKQILQAYKNSNILNSDILKIPHHGSKTSSTKEFLDAVSPKIALIGVGENNKFGHPTDEVIKRLQENGTKIYRTDKMGEISITINQNGKVNNLEKCLKK